MSIFYQFHEQLQDAIVRRLGWRTLRPVQDEAGKAILEGKNAIILAPTAGGKTEASFFPVLSEVLQHDQEGLQVLYIAPIKALLNNQAERLAIYTEMVGLSRQIWHGDIGQSKRKKFLREPDTVLMTTPESLEVMLVSGRVNHTKLFKNLRFVIIDEIHALAGSDRGTHLRSVLHRIFQYSDHDVLRIGLSATVGNPNEILRWLCSDSTRPGLVVNPPAKPSPKEVLVVHRDTDSSLAEAVSSMGEGQKSLLFCQSRSLTEKVAERMSTKGVDTYVHHSSISKEERAKAEELFQKEGAACIVCTSTLELGIDIGDLDKVFQAEAPTTVSSFKQRMGRTGRREGQKANTTFFCGSREGILQAAALVEKTKEGWVESVHINTRSWAVLAHQILTICLGRGGIGIGSLWELLSQVPDFAQIQEGEFYRLILHMIEEQTLDQLDGRILLGPKAEKLFGKRNFMTLYAVFSSPVTYAVETKEKHPIGKLAQDFVDQLHEDGCFILGGRAWAIDAIRHEDRVIRVVPAPGGKQPTWGGILPMFLGFDICQKIKEILLSDDALPYIRGRAGELLAEERADAKVLLSGHEVVTKENAQCWYTYAGGQINSTLKHAITAMTNWKVTADNFCVTIKDTTHQEVCDVIARLRDIKFWSDDSFWEQVASILPQYRLSKFQAVLPQWAIQEMLADYLLDLKGTWMFLSGNTSIEEAHFTTQVKVQQAKKIIPRAPVRKRTRAKRPTNIQCSPHSQLRLPIHYVDTDELLDRLCTKLENYKELGVDCETMIYPPQTMCLLQLACRDFVALIDMLMIKELKPLKALLENPDIVAIAHYSSFEKRKLNEVGIHLTNIYDTWAESKKLRGTKTEGGDKIPHKLMHLCKRELSLTMSKDEQSSNWAKRPLASSQLMYAALDAEVMLQLYDIFQEEEKKQLNLF